jgi:hypothetical protein
MGHAMQGWVVRLGVVTATAVATGCAPVLNIEGSFFPAWMVCLVLGLVLTVAVRQLLVVARLEPHLGPPLLVWPALGLFMTMLTWLVLYRT